jgi:hypothetical protein
LEYGLASADRSSARQLVQLLLQLHLLDEVVDLLLDPLVGRVRVGRIAMASVERELPARRRADAPVSR